MNPADEAWIKVKSAAVMSHTLLALRRLPEVPSLLTYPRAPLGGPAFVVGAGPSLERNGHLLPECAARGLVFATNSSDACVRHYGARADVLVVRESIDTSDQIAASEAPVIAIDVSVHPSAWDAAGARGRWWLPCYPRHYELCRRLNVAPIDGGTAAITAAITMARLWGCSPIVLVGLDCSLGPIGPDGTGLTYHPAAPRGGQRWRLQAGGQRATMLGNEADEARHARSGQHAPGTDLQLEWLPRIGGGAVPTIVTLSDLVDWMAHQAVQWKRGDLVNANESGASIPGWQEQALEDVLRAPAAGKPALAGLTGRSVSQATTTAIAEWLLRGADRMRYAAQELLRDEPSLLNQVHGGLFDRPEILEALASRAMLEAWKRHPDPGTARARAVAQAYIETADAGAMLLEEVLR